MTKPQIFLRKLQQTTSLPLPLIMKRRHERENNADVNSKISYGNNNKYIPIDVTAEILSRLPIKSIGRFISVSKSWRDVITDRHFSSLHAKNKPFSTFYNITPCSAYSQSRHCVFEVDEDGNSVTANFRPRIDEPFGGFQFVGSCNGLLCLLESRPGFDVITILNPITDERSVMTLPKHKYCREEHRWVGEFHKFCYSPSTDEYKVFKYVMIHYKSFEFRGAYAIFTVGVDQRWRELSPHLFSDEWMDHERAVFCDGALHWLIDNDDPSSNHILAFDIAQENTRRMPIRQGIEWHTRLSVFENRVSLYSSPLERPDQGNVVWDTEGSWSQVVVPSRLPVPVRKDDYEEEGFQPLHCATKYGRVLLGGRRYGHTWSYCPKQERHTNIGVVRFCGDRLYEFSPTFSSIEEILYSKSGK